MNQLEEKLKILKKESQKVKRRCIGAWKTLAVIFLILALVLTAIHFVLPLLEAGADALVSSDLWQLAFPDSASGDAVRSLARTVAALTDHPVYGMLRWIAPACWVVFYVTTVLWIVNRPKWRKSMAYLNYRTVANAILDEQEAL